VLDPNEEMRTSNLSFWTLRCAQLGN